MVYKRPRANSWSAGASAFKWVLNNQDTIMKAAQSIKNLTAPRTPKKTERKRSQPESPGMKVKRDKKVYKRRTYNASTSKSKGFIKRGRRRRTYLDKSRLGVTQCLEHGAAPALNVATNCYYVGHATATYNSMLRDISYAIAKFVAIKMDRPLIDFTQYIVDAGNEPCTIAVRGKADSGTNASDIITQVCQAGITTWNDFATNLRTALQSACTNNPYFELIELNLFNNNAPIIKRRYDLSRAKLQFKCKSTLKIQNRTVNSVGNVESDDVDNVPLYGKSYEGNGNFVRTRPSGGSSSDEMTTIGPSPALNVGMITYEAQFTAPSSGNPLAEPPKVSQLYNVRRNGKIHLDPGEIKTSVLYHTINISVNSFFRKFVYKGAIVPETMFGNYRIFAVEKMLKTTLETDVSQMKIAYELDEKRFCKFSAPKVAVASTVLYLGNA